MGGSISFAIDGFVFSVFLDCDVSGKIFSLLFTEEVPHIGYTFRYFCFQQILFDHVYAIKRCYKAQMYKEKIKKNGNRVRKM